MKTTPDTSVTPFDPFSLAFWRSHLSLIILIPYLLGGIWQLLELVSISPVYVRFFSLTQTIPDGLMMLFLLSLLFLAVQVWRKRSVTELWVRKWLPVETTINVKLFVFLINGLTTWSVVFLPLVGSGIIDGETILVSLILVVLWAAIYVSKDSYKHSDPKSIKQKVKKTGFQGLRFFLIVVFVASCISLLPLFFERLSNRLTQLKGNMAESQYNSKVKAYLGFQPMDTMEVEYFNDQYLFVSCGNDKYYIVPFEVLFEKEESLR